MSADLAFLAELVNGLDTEVLEWLQIRISRILAARQPETIVRKTIIRKR